MSLCPFSINWGVGIHCSIHCLCFYFVCVCVCLGGGGGNHVGEEPYHGLVDENEDNPRELVLYVQTIDRINKGSI